MSPATVSAVSPTTRLTETAPAPRTTGPCGAFHPGTGWGGAGGAVDVRGVDQAGPWAAGAAGPAALAELVDDQPVDAGAGAGGVGPDHEDAPVHVGDPGAAPGEAGG